eukprot:TRINITY_DN59927_c0_g1_i1.p1 TRINITY_DN59927_c0_g1~~TRINITY_DN59927_c0_g1_i1.p1  ORF type:complete len:407 (-),score=75.86 TRINITY_DN59927_c0_g1_i1:202-1422(-)
MAALLDLDTGFLSSCLSRLAAHSQGASVCACKHFAVIVSELRQESTFLKSAVTEDVDATLAELTPKLVSPPSVGVLFAGSRLSANSEERSAALKKLVCSLPPAIHLIGGHARTLVGTCPDGTLSVRPDDGFALTLGSFPEADVKSFVVKSSHCCSHQDMLDQLQSQGAMDEGWKVIVVMTTCSCCDLLELLQTTHPKAAIIGGVVEGNWMVRAHCHRVQVVRDGVVGLMFRGNVPLSAVVCQRQHDAAKQLRRARQEAEEQGNSVLGGLMFTCCARDEFSDAKAFMSAFPATPLAGMPCGGEIGPDASESPGSVTQVGNVKFQGYTAVYGLFSHPVRSGKVPLYFAEVSDAYRKSRSQPAALAAAAAVQGLKSLRVEEGLDCHKEIELEQEESAFEDDEDDEDYDN